MHSAFYRIALAAVAGTVLLGSGPAHAWSKKGHRIIGQVAYEHLTPVAKAEVNRLLALDPTLGERKCPVTTLADAAYFPDCVRGDDELLGKYHYMSSWHFDNRSKCGVPEQPVVFCKDGNCATEAIRRAYRTLSLDSASDSDKLLALKQIAHFVGDIHQPLHMGDKQDRGGNSIPVRYPGSSANGLDLHKVWDDKLVEAALKPAADEADFRAMIPQTTPTRQISELESWAEQSYRIAIDFSYGRLSHWPNCGNAAQREEITAQYVADAEPIVRGQLVSGGMRLAGLLNSALE